MRIKSNFHDYYDGVQSHQTYVDDDILYVRKKEEEIVDNELRYKFHCQFPKTKPFNSHYLHPKHVGYPQFEIDSYLIGFCGKIYPVVKILFFYTYSKRDCVWAYNQETLEKFLDLHQTKKNADFIKYAKKESKRLVFIDGINRDYYLEIFLQKNVPIFTLRKYNYNKDIVTWNDELHSYEFFKVFDPYSAFQEISMFLGNIAKKEKPIPFINDKIMVEAKGFDRFSFRKDKRKKN